MNKLKPCPFCGRKGRILKSTKADAYCVKCARCHARTGYSYVKPWHHGNKFIAQSNATEEWNHRVPQEPEAQTIQKREAAIKAGDEYGYLDSHDEKYIVERCISLMQGVASAVQEWLEWVGFDLNSMDGESRFQYSVSYFQIVQQLLLWHTHHSGGTSTRAKCSMLGIDSSQRVNFTFDMEDENDEH